MKNIAIIPARMNSSRFPGKPMEKMLNMPMIGHCYYRTKMCNDIDDVYVATCDEVIANYIDSIGGKFILTSDSHKRASTRTSEALKIIESSSYNVDSVVMVQGDEPLVSPDSISKALRNLVNNDTNIVNIMSKFKEEDAFRDKNNVKVVVDINNNALYFSREPIPSPWKGWRKHSSFMQTGIIAFKSNALYDFNNQEETALELVESIDMNRVLENGGKVRMVLSEEFMIGVDTKEELILAENELKTSKFTSEYL